MKIKQKNLVRLDELIKHVWDKRIVEMNFKSKNGVSIYVHSDGNIDVDEVRYISKYDLFTITEEVEITEEMELKQLVVIYENGGSGKIRNMNIKELVERHESVYGHGVPIKFIYLQNEDGSIGELIWDKERGLID